MKIDIQNLFLFVGFVQCLLIIVFAITRKKTTSTKLFAALLIVLGLSLLNNIVFFPSYYGRWNTVLDYAIPELIFLIGPLTYFYTRSLFEKQFTLERRHFYHFAPAMLDLSMSIYAIVIWAMGLDNIPLDGIVNEYFYFLDSAGQYLSYPQFMSITVYLYFSWKFIRKNKPIADTKTYLWSRDILIGITLIDLMWMPYVVLSFSSLYLVWVDWIYFYPVFYPLSAFFYYLTYRIAIGGMTHRPNPATKEELEEQRRNILQALGKDNLYTQADLNLKLKGFNQFINEYRIEKAIEKIKNGDSDRLSIEGIGMEVGFSSRTTFYRSFKQKTGKSPVELLKQ